jgi:hypothetical protein
MTPWIIFLINVLFYFTLDKLQQLVNDNYYKDIRQLLVINWNPVQFLFENENNPNRKMLFGQKLSNRKFAENKEFYLERNGYLSVESIYINRLSKMNQLYWNHRFRKKILVIMEFILKEQSIQKNSFTLEKHWNYIILDWKTYYVKIEGILNRLINKVNNFRIKEYYSLIDQSKSFLFLMILEMVVNL